MNLAWHITPFALPRRQLLIAIALMVLAVALAEGLRPTRFWADHTGEPHYEQLVPHSFGDWQELPYANRGVVNPVQEENLKRIYSETFARTFVNRKTGRMVMLSIAYGRDQSNDTQLHTPDMCYPSQGFQVTQRQDVDLHTRHGDIKATQLVADMGSVRHEPLTYFIRVGDTVARGSRDRNLERIRLSLHGYLVDGTLVRVSEITRAQDAFAVQERFVRDLLDAMPAHDRAYLIGGREG